MKALYDIAPKMVGFFYSIATIMIVLMIYFYGNKKFSEPIFIFLVAIPVCRNIFILARSFKQKDWLTFHMSVLGMIFFVLVAIYAR